MLLSLEEVSVRFARRVKPSPPSYWRRWLPWPLKSCFQDALVLDRLSLDVAKNDFLAILGSSGSGKTTLLRTIAGLTTPFCGRIMLDGSNITIEPPHRREVSLIFQNGGWYDHLTVKQHFEFDGLKGNAIDSLLRQLDLQSVRHQYPAELSGGQAQRLAIGRGLVRQRAVLLLDEPLSQLDQSMRESLRDLLISIHGQDRTLIYVTHDQNDVMLLASRIAVLHCGKIQQIGLPQELFDSPNHSCVASMLGQPKMQFFRVQLSRADRLKWITQCESNNPRTSLEALPAIQRGMMSDTLQDDSDSETLVGIRPGAWRVTNQDESSHEHPAGSEVSFIAKLVEERFMGYQRLLQFIIPNTSMPKIHVLSDLRNPRLRVEPGACYRIGVANRDLHFFDGKTGNRLTAFDKLVGLPKQA